MNKVGIWLVVAMIMTALVGSGCGDTKVTEVKETTVYRPNVQPTESTPTPVGPSPSVQPAPGPQPSQSSEPAWVNEKRQAQGQGVIDMQRFPNPAQAKLMAKRAAMMDARRNLLETILGLRIDSKTVVRDMVAESDQIDANTSGIIRNSYEIGANYGSDGICTVTMEVKLYDIWAYVRQEHTYTR